jgi:hypothetical protein
LATTYRIADSADLCKLALELAFDPAKARFADADAATAALEQLGIVPALARGTFLARLVADRVAETVLADGART